MTLLSFTLIVSFILWMLYMTFEPKLDVILQPRKRVVVLWYNLFVEDHREAKRVYKYLLTIKRAKNLK